MKRLVPVIAGGVARFSSVKASRQLLYSQAVCGSRVPLQLSLSTAAASCAAAASAAWQTHPSLLA